MGHTVKRDHDHQDYSVYEIHNNICMQIVMRKKTGGLSGEAKIYIAS